MMRLFSQSTGSDQASCTEVDRQVSGKGAPALAVFNPKARKGLRLYVHQDPQLNVQSAASGQVGLWPLTNPFLCDDASLLSPLLLFPIAKSQCQD